MKRVGLLLAMVLVLAACDKNTPLMKNVLDQDTEAVEKALASGTAVNEQNHYGWTALMHAARIGNAPLVETLIKRGAGVDIKDKDGWTPLIRAALKNHTEVVRLLLEHGAAVNATENTGRSALHWAAVRGNAEAVQLLLAKGANPSLMDLEKWTPTMLARKEGYPEIAQILDHAEKAKH